MNQGRIWCVVNPTVGLPLFLGSVALTSVVVHFAILSHTNWMSNYWAGNQKAKVSMEQGTLPPVAANTVKGDPAFVISVAPVSGSTANQQASFVVTVAPNPVTVAKADAGPADPLALTAAVQK